MIFQSIIYYTIKVGNYTCEENYQKQFKKEHTLTFPPIICKYSTNQHSDRIVEYKKIHADFPKFDHFF